MAKVSTACNPCAVRKIKCNGAKPCPACLKSGIECAYTVHHKRGPKGPRPATIARINKTLEERKARSEFGPSPTITRDQSQLQQTASDFVAGSAQFSVNGSTRGSVTTTSPPARLSIGSGGAYPSASIVCDTNVTLDEVASYLQVYDGSLYPVWPVVDTASLLRRIQGDPGDFEACTLAFALCAATTARLRIDSPTDAPNSAPQLATSTWFAELAEITRGKYSWRAQASIEGIMIPFFLHVHYDCKCKLFMDSLLLREAITVAQLMGLEKEDSYTALGKSEQNMRRKLFWLLFVSERGCSMMRDFPISLQPSIQLPEPKYEENPGPVTAFIGLVKLFVSVSGVFGNGGPGKTGASSQRYTCQFFARLQQELGRDLQCPSKTHEMQKADIYLTQQWLQILIWRFSMGHVDLSTRAGEEELSLTYPAKIAKSAMGSLMKLPFDSIVAHGRGMEQKVFEIASTLLDVINVVPDSLNETNASSRSTDTSSSSSIFYSLSSILSILGGGQSPYVELLQKKISESRLPLPLPRMSMSPDSRRLEFERGRRKIAEEGAAFTVRGGSEVPMNPLTLPSDWRASPSGNSIVSWSP